MCAGDMWALGVLLAALLTGGVPPLAQHLGRAPRKGLSVDALQCGVTAVVRRALDDRGVCFPARVSSRACRTGHGCGPFPKQLPARPLRALRCWPVRVQTSPRAGGCAVQQNGRRGPLPYLGLRALCMGAQALVESLLQVDAAQRLTASAVRVHPWVLGCTSSRPAHSVALVADARASPAQQPALYFSLEAQAAMLAAPRLGAGSLDVVQQLRQQQSLLSHGARVDALPALVPSGHCFADTLPPWTHQRTAAGDRPALALAAGSEGYGMAPNMAGYGGDCGALGHDSACGDVSGEDRGGPAAMGGYVAAWLQRVLARCRQRACNGGDSAMDADNLSEHISRELILHHL